MSESYTIPPRPFPQPEGSVRGVLTYVPVQMIGVGALALPAQHAKSSKYGRQEVSQPSSGVDYLPCSDAVRMMVEDLARG